MRIKMSSPALLFLLILLCETSYTRNYYPEDGILTDPNGYTYIAGVFRNPVLIFGKYNLKNSGGSDIFLAKYGKDSKVIWAKNIGGDGDEEIESVELDQYGNVILRASSGSSIINLVTSQLINDKSGIIFRADFNSAGNCIFSDVEKVNSSALFNKTSAGDTSLTLISPAGGDVWKVGTKEVIEWSAENIISVLLEISYNGGADWQIINISDNFNLEYPLVVPDTLSDSCFIRISDYTNPRFADTSSLFSISGELLWKPADDSFNSVFRNIYTTSEACWVAGYNGLLKTTDEGESWNPYLDGYGLWDVFFLNDSTGWVIGFYGTMFKTTNAGADWVPMENDFNFHLFKIYFADENNGYMISDSYFLKTTDGGLNWNSDQITEHTLKAMYFINKDTGWIAGSEGVILKTTDAGINWDYQQLEGTLYSYLNSVFFIDENLGWISGAGLDIEGGVILKTNNSGDLWSLNHNGFNTTIFSICFSGPDSGWAAGDEGIMFNTTNGGIDWELQGSGTLENLYTVNFNSSGKGWAVGGGGVILKMIESASVPVELIAFNLSTRNSEVELKWSTASETNNRGFEIERSQEFNQKWDVIAFVEGTGTTAGTKTYSFIDKSIASGNYSYRLKQIDFDGSFEYSEILDVSVNTPLSFELSQNYPNPFNPVTKIVYSIYEDTRVVLKVFDILGREVKTLADEERRAGIYEVNFDARDISSGTYFYTLKAGDLFATRKMILIK